jgi:hypothetical protein
MLLLAAEWPYLDGPLRDSAVNIVLPMWNTDEWSNGSTLRYVLLDLSRTANGRQLLLAGLISDPEALRSFNRWAIGERIYGR